MNKLAYILIITFFLGLSAQAITYDGIGAEVIPTSRNLGIGKNSPQASFHVNGNVNISNGLSLFETTTSNGTVEATQFCTGDGETNCISDFNLIGGSSLRDTARGLVIKNNTSNPLYQVDIDADEIILQNTSDTSQRVTSVNLTASISTSGANGLDTGSEAVSTWYHIWVIYNGSTVAGLLSTSSTAPTMPSGYTYKAYVGAIYNDSGNDFISIYQQGKIVNRTPVNAVNDGIITTYTSVDLSAYIPPNAIRFFGDGGLSNTYYNYSLQGADFKPRSADTLGEVRLATYSETLTDKGQLTWPISMPLIEAQTVYYKCYHSSIHRSLAAGCSASDGTRVLLQVTGWELP